MPHLRVPPQSSYYTGLQCSLTLQCQIQCTLGPLILYMLPTLVRNTVVNALKGTTNLKLLHPGKDPSIIEGLSHSTLSSTATSSKTTKLQLASISKHDCKWCSFRNFYIDFIMAFFTFKISYSFTVYMSI